MRFQPFRLTFASLFALAVSVGPYSARPSRAQTGAASNSSFIPDKGKFRIVQGGNEVGSEEFDLAPSGSAWVAHGEAVLHIPGTVESRSSGQLRLSPDGLPIRYDWSAGSDKKASGSVTFDPDGTAKTAINLPGHDPLRQDFKFSSPRVAVLDNNLYDQYAILARLYDWDAKGKQTLPVLVPQDSTPGSIDVESLGPADGKLDELRVHTSDLDIEVYFDTKHRLMRIEVPSANVVVSRQ